ncbi:DUF1080 domain-containing protein [uncultured Paludibaculum sp.]|uniref:3-keto-disaccharide hydrolase n=1 Tax=uncultured Paludibaculum sp. TaxID=1765020 RepID=UPI002AABEEAA|nr:DUF1080 domain-containing protein [uncultured Paludibaculum sp.]
MPARAMYTQEMLALLLLLMQPPVPPVSLFDGHSSAGWLEVTGQPFPSKSWVVEDGCLKARVVDGGFQDIRTEATFREFELEFEWKIEPGGNSGVKYLIDKVDTWKAKTGEGINARGRGPEYQLIDDDMNADSKGNPRKQTASLYGKIAPATHAAKPAGEFNASRIVVRGGHVEHWLNGVKELEYEAPVKDSPIVLQNHHSAVWFRNIRIRRLNVIGR